MTTAAQATETLAKLQAPAAKKAPTKKPAAKKPAAKKPAAKAKPAPKAPVVTAPEAGISRLNITDRTAQILEAAVKVAGKEGLMAITRDLVAAEAGISAALVTRYFGGMDQLREAIVERAVTDTNARILAEALTYKMKGATKVKSKVKDAVVKYLFN